MSITAIPPPANPATAPATSLATRRRSSLRRFLRPYRGSLSLASGLILVEAMLDLARPWPLKLAVDNAIGGQPLGGPLAVLDGLGPAGVVAVAAGLGIGLVGIGALVGYLITYLTSATAERVGADLRESLFGRLLGLGLPFHDRHRSGDLVTRLTGDVGRVEDSMVAWFTVLVPEALTLVGMVVVVLAVDLTLGLAALAVVPPLALVVAMRRRRIRVAQRASRDADAALASEATEVLRNVRVVQAFTREGEAVAEAPEPLPAGPPHRGLALRGVWFAYAEGAPVLRHLDLEVAAGERVCMVGPTGAGKSTLLSLLLRFYDPGAGVVELDGTDLRDLELASLRRQLALVPQDPWMLDGTIADNIAFGSSWGGPGGRTPPRMDQGPPQDERLAAVAVMTGLNELVERLPEGWQTQIGEGGVRLSGGQRRRVALARAILRDASVLLLDEPTSGLDAASEQAVLDALDRAAEGRTVLAVSHRLSLAARSDRVVVLSDGRVVEQGAPAELLAAGGTYARLWALQRPRELSLTSNSGEGVNP